MIRIPSSARSLLALGLAAYLLFAIVSFPASLAAAWFAPDRVVMSGVSGTVWSGHANTIATGAATLIDTSWRARPLSLLTGRLSHKLNGTVFGGAIEATASISANGTIRLSNLSGIVPLNALPSIAPSVQIDGRLGLDIDNVLIENEWPTDATGTIDIVALRLVGPVAESLGSFEVVFAGAGESGLEALVSAVDGPLDVNGTLSLSTDKQWNLTGNVKPKPSASAQLSQGLEFLGTRNPDGSFTVSYPSR